MKTAFATAIIASTANASTIKDSTCKITNVKLYMDEQCTMPYRSTYYLELSKKATDDFRQKSMYATDNCTPFDPFLDSTN